MAKYLVIVESPGKIKTISSFLSSDYVVMASIGHVEVLDKTGKYNLGIDLENDFKPSFSVDPKKKDVVKKLKAAAKTAETVYLATDSDLEGEAISASLQRVLKVPKTKLKRVTFNEITKKAVLDAINNPREINEQRVDAQMTRRLIDRIAGFRLSNLVLSKLNSKSAGRVQSAALKILVDKELEIQAFKPKTYFEIYLPFTKDKKEFKAQYKGTDKKTMVSIPDQKIVDKILKESTAGNYKVEKIEKKDRKISPKAPYTTSTFQQECSSRLNYGSKKAMKIAQSLYEGINIGNEHFGLITYMRTDSTRLSDDFINDAKKFVIDSYGKEYYAGKVTKAGGSAQDAHEGIRPSHLEFKPEDIKQHLSSEEFKVYKLIYSRAIASLMTDAKAEDTNVIIDNNNHKFAIKGKEIKFDGFLKVYEEFNEDSQEDIILPAFTIGEKINDKPLEVEKKQTQPPKRYTEAKLVKELEKLGIGRPSTYASIMDTLTKRDYTTKENKTLIPTEKGIELIKMLQEYFNESVLDVKYTAELESKLDQISEGKAEKTTELKTFFEEFNPLVLKAQREFKKESTAQPTDRICPKCQAPLVIRKGKYGDFYACSRYPHCKFTEKIVTEEDKKLQELREEELKTAPTCPVCNKGKLIMRIAKKGKNAGTAFYACNNFPKCKTTFTEEEFKTQFVK